jgi:acetyltransferase-like isoleucine patch superfamily enzyme
MNQISTHNLEGQEYKEAKSVRINLEKIIGGFRGLLLKQFFKQCGFPLVIENGVKLSKSKTIEIGDRVYIRSSSQILENVKIHNNVFIGHYCDIGKNTVLEDDVTLADYVCILGDTHDYSNINKRAGKMYSLGSKIIGKGAWIGYRAIILPQVSYIRRGAVVGAGSVVTKDVPDGCIVVGNPARIVTKN